MTEQQKQQRYQRIIEQLQQLLKATDDPICRMATIASLLYHKMGHFFWIGFYRHIDGQLLIGPYQGAIACQTLPKDTGVCWAAVNARHSIIVPDVNQFPGHIACDARSQSEIVIPVMDKAGAVSAVLDADSDKRNTFDNIDAENLAVIARLVYTGST